MNGRIVLGQIAEQKFTVGAVENGFRVCRPITHDSPYDFIIEKEGILFRIQVKSTSREPYGGKKTYQVSINRDYEQSAFDYYAIFVGAIGLFHLVPKALITTKTIHFRLNRSECKFGGYRDNWELS
jgi:hypothetical protein